MVSIISRLLQKKMPSYGEIKSKVTKEQIEDNESIANSIKLHIFWLICITACYMFFNHEKIYVISYPALLAMIMAMIFTVISIIMAFKFKILKFKFDIFMLLCSLSFGYLTVIGMALFMTNDLVLDIILIIINAIIVYFVFLKKVIKTTKYQIFIKFGCVFAFISGIWEMMFGNGIKEGFIDAILCIIFFNAIFKMMLNYYQSYLETLFYVLAYPEKFRRKFGYSVKEWYGKRSPQYREEKKLNQ